MMHGTMKMKLKTVQAIVVHFPEWARNFLLKAFHVSSGALLASCSVGTRGPFPTGKVASALQLPLTSI